jgi:hypothetical protein
MTVLWLDPLSILLLYVNFVDLVQICCVILSWILSANTSGFFVLCCIIKLILGPINFPTGNTSTIVLAPSDVLPGQRGNQIEQQEASVLIPVASHESGVRKEKVYTDGIMKYGFFTSTGEPS